MSGGTVVKTDKIRRNFLTTFLSLILLSFHGNTWANNGFDQIFFFGDSLSDPGNVYALTGVTSKAPYDLVPSAPYAIGGQQFSNGKTWAQRFSQNLRLNSSGKPALDSPGKNGNYAFGGARARLGSGSLTPSSLEQVGLFLIDHPVADSDALYVVQFGGNDIRDALVSLDQTIVADAVTAIIDKDFGVIKTLYDRGARHFLLVGAPNLGLTPAVSQQGPLAVFFAELLSNEFNNGLTLGAGLLQFLHPDISIAQLDIFSILQSVVDTPENFGIENVTDPCLTFNVKSGAKCSEPEGYLFWDGIHPTSVIHKLVGARAEALYQ